MGGCPIFFSFHSLAERGAFLGSIGIFFLVLGSYGIFTFRGSMDLGIALVVVWRGTLVGGDQFVFGLVAGKEREERACSLRCNVHGFMTAVVLCCCGVSFLSVCVGVFARFVPSFVAVLPMRLEILGSSAQILHSMLDTRH